MIPAHDAARSTNGPPQCPKHGWASHAERSVTQEQGPRKQGAVAGAVSRMGVVAQLSRFARTAVPGASRTLTACTACRSLHEATQRPIGSKSTAARARDVAPAAAAGRNGVLDGLVAPAPARASNGCRTPRPWLPPAPFKGPATQTVGLAIDPGGHLDPTSGRLSHDA